MEEHVSFPASRDPPEHANVSEKSEDVTQIKVIDQSEIESSIEASTDQENKASPGKELEREEVGEIESSSISLIDSEFSEASTSETSHKNVTVSDHPESDCSSTSPFRAAKHVEENLKAGVLPESEIVFKSSRIKTESKDTNEPTVKLTGKSDEKPLAVAPAKHAAYKTEEHEIFRVVSKEPGKDETSKPTSNIGKSNADDISKSVCLNVEEISASNTKTEIKHTPKPVLDEASSDLKVIALVRSELYTDILAKALEKTSFNMPEDIFESATVPSTLDPDVIPEGEARHIEPPSKAITDSIQHNIPVPIPVSMAPLADAETQTEELLDTVGEGQCPEEEPEPPVDPLPQSVTQDLQVEPPSNDQPDNSRLTIREKILIYFLLIVIFIIMCILGKFIYDVILYIMENYVI